LPASLLTNKSSKLANKPVNKRASPNKLLDKLAHQ
jgi:hypothetical protein